MGSILFNNKIFASEQINLINQTVVRIHFLNFENKMKVVIGRMKDFDIRINHSACSKT